MDPDEAKNVPKHDAEFPDLEARREFDRGMLMKKAMEAGMTREQAKRHVEEHHQGEARMRGQTEEDVVEDYHDVGIDNPEYDDDVSEFEKSRKS